MNNGRKDYERSVNRLFVASGEMIKGRATLPWRAVAGQKGSFITLGGPKAHDNSVENAFPQWLSHGDGDGYGRPDARCGDDSCRLRFNPGIRINRTLVSPSMEKTELLHQISHSVPCKSPLMFASWLCGSCSGRMHSKRSVLPKMKWSSRPLKSVGRPSHPVAKLPAQISR